VLRPLGAFIDPSPQKLDLLGGQFPPRFRRRHTPSYITRCNSGDQFTFAGLTANERMPAVTQRRKCPFLGIQPQFRLSFFLVWTVALNAMFCEQRPDLPIEVDSSGGLSPSRGSGYNNSGQTQSKYLKRHAASACSNHWFDLREIG
jgi:hypothetical protein